MPNHCYNQLVLQSGGDILGVLNPYLTFRGDDDYAFDFHKLIPEPEGETPDWHGWRVANWGTKWNGYDGRFNDNQTMFSFDTAWAPPLPVIKELAKATGETFVLEYIEEGNFFCGRYTAGQDGDHDEFYNDIKAAPQELKDSLGYVPWEEEEEECVEEATTKDLQIVSFSCAAVTQIIPDGWKDWIWTPLGDGAPFSCGDNNHSLVDAVGFGEHLDRVLKAYEAEEKFQETIKEHRPAVFDIIRHLEANKIYIDLER
jgi:hypothetical protein